jgi:hypothetical protein
MAAFASGNAFLGGISPVIAADSVSASPEYSRIQGRIASPCENTQLP